MDSTTGDGPSSPVQCREQATPEAAVLRQAIADTHGETLERHGGIDAAIKRVLQVEEQSASTNDPGMIDDFRLWGSSRCRQMGRHLSDGGVAV